MVFFYDDLLVYHTKRVSSSLSRACKQARAMPFDNKMIVVNGESKPGIRPANVTMIRFRYD